MMETRPETTVAKFCVEHGHEFDELRTPEKGEREMWTWCKRCGAIWECDIAFGAQPRILHPKGVDNG